MKEFRDKIKKRILEKLDENFDKYFDMILKTIKYVACAIGILFFSKILLKYPLKLAEDYCIDLSGSDYVQLIKNYTVILLGVIVISVLAIPIARLVSKLKSVSKEGASFYNDEQQNTYNTLNKVEVQEDAVRDLINSDDNKIWDEKSEEDLYNRVLRSKDDTYNMLKCKNIKNNMKPLTMIVTRELYNNCRGNITAIIVTEYVKKLGNRKKKKQDEKNQIIAKNIIEFLINNDIIESDDIESEKYYFTQLGNIFMNYFQNGII